MDNVLSNKTTLEDRILKMAAMTDDFEGYKSQHSMRLAILADAVAQKLNLAAHDRNVLKLAAFVHDIGEVVMNREYIKSNRPLTDEERLDMQRHTVIGEQEAAKRGLDRGVQLLIRWHHEWWNGSGYPDALCREQIPLPARILRVVDTYVALTDHRPFSVPISEYEAKRYLVEWSAVEFDPKVVKIFLSLEGLTELKSAADRT